MSTSSSAEANEREHNCEDGSSSLEGARDNSFGSPLDPSLLERTASWPPWLMPAEMTSMGERLIQDCVELAWAACEDAITTSEMRNSHHQLAIGHSCVYVHVNDYSAVCSLEVEVVMAAGSLVGIDHRTHMAGKLRMHTWPI